jgi:RNA 2',3'-cyclic 3'-phosphodiesterase
VRVSYDRVAVCRFRGETISMSEPLRTFIAVKVSLPQALRTVLRRFREMGRAVKAVDSDTTHITLKFLGDTPADQLAEVGRIVETVAGDFKSFDLELTGLGAFPHWGRPQVAWVGINPSEPLVEMARRLETELEPLGFRRERRAYHPHLTLARIKARPPAVLQDIAEAHETTSFGTQTIDQVVWYQSELQKTGPIYTPLSTTVLQSPAD